MKSKEKEEKKETVGGNSLTKLWVVSLLAVLCCLLWGSAYPCVKIGYELFQVTDTGSKILFAGCRFTLAGLLVILVTSLGQRRLLKPQRESGPMLLALACTQTIGQYACFYIGMSYSDGIKGAILGASGTFFCLLFSAVWIRERIGAIQWGGCLLGFAGVILSSLAGGSLSGGFTAAGEGMVLLSSVFYAVASILLKLFSQKEDPRVLTGCQFVIGGLVLAAGGFCMGGRLAPRSGLAFLLLFYMACISAVAFTVWGLLLKYNSVSRVTIFGFATPLFGSLLSALFLGEQLWTVSNLASLLFVCVGILLVNRK